MPSIHLELAIWTCFLSAHLLTPFCDSAVAVGCAQRELCCIGRQVNCFSSRLDKNDVENVEGSGSEVRELRVRESMIVVEQIMDEHGQTRQRTIPQIPINFASHQEQPAQIVDTASLEDTDNTNADEVEQILYDSVNEPEHGGTYKFYYGVKKNESSSEMEDADAGNDTTRDERPVLRYTVVDPNTVPLEETHKMAFFEGRRARRRRGTPITNVDDRCYCDEVCLRLGDCCHDFVDYCKPRDCVQSPWSEWSICKAPVRSAQNDSHIEANEGTKQHCGVGVQTRTRTQMAAAYMGGKRCGVAEQQRACYSACQPVLEETALILPAKYELASQPGRYPTMYHDLPSARRVINNHTSYCISFKPVWLSSHCKKNNIKSILSKKSNATVVVKCQHPALSKEKHRCIGVGLENIRSFWKLAAGDKTCFGAWERLPLDVEEDATNKDNSSTAIRQDKPPCDPSTKSHFIFV